MWDAEHAPRHDRLERGDQLAEGESGGSVGGPAAGDATVNEQTAERDDKRLETNPSDDEPMGKTEKRAGG